MFATRKTTVMRLLNPDLIEHRITVNYCKTADSSRSCLTGRVHPSNLVALHKLDFQIGGTPENIYSPVKRIGEQENVGKFLGNIPSCSGRDDAVTNCHVHQFTVGGHIQLVLYLSAVISDSLLAQGETFGYLCGT